MRNISTFALKQWIMEKKFKNVTVQEVAARFNVSLRTVHHWLQNGRVIPGISSYEKLNPDNRNSPYIIKVAHDSDFNDKRKKLVWENPEEEVDYLK